MPERSHREPGKSAPPWIGRGVSPPLDSTRAAATPPMITAPTPAQSQGLARSESFWGGASAAATALGASDSASSAGDLEWMLIQRAETNTGKATLAEADSAGAARAQNPVT